MLLPMFEVGYGNYLFAESVVMLLNPLSKPARRIITSAKEENRYLDLTTGKAGSCLILLTTGEVAMSAIDVNTIRKRYMKYVNEINQSKETVSLEPFLEIGYKNYILPYRVTGIYNAGPTPIGKIVKNAKSMNTLIDCKQGRELKSILVLETGHVVISAISSETIKKRYMDYVDKINKNNINDYIEDIEIENEEIKVLSLDKE